MPVSVLAAEGAAAGAKDGQMSCLWLKNVSSGSFHLSIDGHPAVSCDLGVLVGGGELKVLVLFSLASSLQKRAEFRGMGLHGTCPVLFLCLVTPSQH